MSVATVLVQLHYTTNYPSPPTLRFSAPPMDKSQEHSSRNKHSRIKPDELHASLHSWVRMYSQNNTTRLAVSYTTRLVANKIALGSVE